MKSLWRAFRFFRPERSRTAAVFVLLVAALCLGVFKPWPLAWVIDHILGNEPWPGWTPLATWPVGTQLIALIVLLVVLHAGYAALTSLHTYLAIGIGLRGLTRVRNEVFAVLQRLTLRFRHGARAGDLIYRAATDTYAFQNFFQHGFITLVTAVLYLAFLLLVMFQINPRLALLAAALVPLLALTIRYFGGQMRQRGLQAQQAESAVTSLLQQGLLALPLTQSYTREDHEKNRFGQQATVAQEHKRSQHGWEVLYGLMVSLCLAGGTAGITWLGANEVLENRLSLGELIVFLAYLGQMFEPLNQLGHVGATLTSATVGVQRVFELIDTPVEVTEDPQARPVWAAGDPEPAAGAPTPVRLQGRLRFENVSFSYQDDLPVLRDINFELAPGESTAIIGPSGAGKTTLLNLLPRFYDPSEGRVLLDGVDLRRLRLRDLRAHIAVVMQEPIILPATVAENIAYGRPDATLAELRQAAEAAHADAFIRDLPRGYETPIGEAGHQLSVGERQRINLARAFLKNAPILLLDEPTSALDTESEQLIVRALSSLMQDRTTLLVAHRLTTIRSVRKVIVLENGRLTEFGTPAELKHGPGYFSRVLTGQASLG